MVGINYKRVASVTLNVVFFSPVHASNIAGTMYGMHSKLHI